MNKKQIKQIFEIEWAAYIDVLYRLDSSLTSTEDSKKLSRHIKGLKKLAQKAANNL